MTAFLHLQRSKKFRPVSPLYLVGREIKLGTQLLTLREEGICLHIDGRYSADSAQSAVIESLLSSPFCNLVPLLLLLYLLNIGHAGWLMARMSKLDASSPFLCELCNAF